MSLNKLGEKSHATIILGKFCKQAIMKLSLAYNFRKMFFIGQNLKHVHMTYSFLELLNMYVNINFMGNQSWNTIHELVSDINVEKTCFFKCKIKTCMINFNVSQFHGHIYRSSRSQMFFKIGALKNFAILRIKKGLQHTCFSVRSSHMMLTYW